jgi:hypothetical protein
MILSWFFNRESKNLYPLVFINLNSPSKLYDIKF